MQQTSAMVVWMFSFSKRHIDKSSSITNIRILAMDYPPPHIQISMSITYCQQNLTACPMRSRKTGGRYTYTRWRRFRYGNSPPALGRIGCPRLRCLRR